jgi:hypothetical protein
MGTAAEWRVNPKLRRRRWTVGSEFLNHGLAGQARQGLLHGIETKSRFEKTRKVRELFGIAVTVTALCTETYTFW